MIKREADFTVKFRHWLKAYPMMSGAFEVKQTTKESIPFAHIKEHQTNALLAVSRGQFLYKIPDDSMGYKPFDLVYFNRAFGYVVLKFPGRFHIISIDIFLKEKEESPRKSLTNKRAEEISIKTVKLKK